MLTESVLLSLIGGALGVLFAFAATRTIVAMMPEFYVPNESRVEINLPVLRDARFANRLSFGAAFRASDYSTVGKTNTCELGQWPFTSGPAFGHTLNPWSPDPDAPASGGRQGARPRR